MLKQIGPLTDLGPGRSTQPGKTQQPNTSFDEVLAQQSQKQGDVRFSAHARERLESRNIHLTEQHQARLDDAVNRADQKGANQSLVMLDDLALVVSVRNRVVITALDDSKAKSGVFTNIDSAVIA
ncbi:MAG TPA: TIGR02530 family flagellar biosynthesis protein [Armatimonadota bacterium]